MTKSDVRRKLTTNERLKLLAAFVNGMGLATFAVGGLAPIFSKLYADGGVTGIVILTSSVCILGAFALHYAGSLFLKRLIP